MFKRLMHALVLPMLLITTIAWASSETFYYPTGDASPTIIKTHTFGAISPPDADKSWLCGIRIEAKPGAAVYAVADGEVAKISPYGWGNGSVGVIIRHLAGGGRSFIAIYGGVRNYATGRVRAGEKIGTAGSQGYIHFGIFDSANGAGEMPFVNKEAEYAAGALPRPEAETIDSITSYGRWFDPLEYLRKRSPQRFEEEEQPTPPKGAPNMPLISMDDADTPLKFSPDNHTLRLKVRPGHGAVPSGYRFRVRRMTTNWWITDWADWTSEWVTLNGQTFIFTHILPPGDYWWEAQARNDFGEGMWQISAWRFHVNYPPAIPVPQSPSAGSFLKSRDVRLSWSDGGDPDNRPHRHRDFRVLVDGDWSYDSGWGVRSTSINITVPRDGHFTWRVAASDGLNESAYCSPCKFTVDTTPPDIKIGGPVIAKWIKEGSVSWEVADSVSGVKQSYLKWDDGSGESTVEPNGAVGLHEGKHSVTVRAVDNAGNQGTATYGVIWADLTAPELKISLNPANPTGRIGGYKDTCTLTASAQDSVSGVDQITCWMTGVSGGRYTVPITITQPGPHEYHITAVDMAGNESSSQGTVLIELKENTVTLPSVPVGPTPTPTPTPAPPPSPSPTPIPAPKPLEPQQPPNANRPSEQMPYGRPSTPGTPTPAPAPRPSEPQQQPPPQANRPSEQRPIEKPSTPTAPPTPAPAPNTPGPAPTPPPSGSGGGGAGSSNTPAGSPGDSASGGTTNPNLPPTQLKEQQRPKPPAPVM